MAKLHYTLAGVHYEAYRIVEMIESHKAERIENTILVIEDIKKRIKNLDREISNVWYTNDID